MGRKVPPAREDLALSDRVFVRPGCGRVADRDHNASLNIPRGSGWEPPWSPWSSALYPLSAGSLVREGGGSSPGESAAHSSMCNMAYIAEDGSPSHCEIGAGKATDGFHSSKRIGKLAHTHRTRGGAWASLHHTTPRGFIGIPPLLVVRCPPTGVGRTFASHSSCRWELHPSSGGGRSPR